MLKIHIDSINLSFLLVYYDNLIWALASIWIFLCNYAVHSIWLILTYIFRDYEQLGPVTSTEQNKSNDETEEDYDVDEFTKELANFLFPSYEEFLISNEEEEEEEEEEKTKYCVLVENSCDLQYDDEKGKEEIDSYNFNEKEVHNVFDGFHEDVMKLKESETFMGVFDGFHDVMKSNENETFMHSLFDGFHEDVMKINIFEEGDSNFHQDGRKSVEKVQEDEEEDCDFIANSYATTTSKCQFVSQKDIDSMEKKRLSFLRNVSYNNVFFNTKDLHNLEECHVVDEEDEDEYVQEHRKFSSSSTFDASNNTNDDSLTSDIPCEDIGYESHKEVEDLKETQFSCDREEVSQGFLRCKKEETYEGSLEKNEDDDDDDDDDDESESNEIMKQIKLKLMYARQGGLSTIFEDEEEDDDEKREYYLKVVEMIKPLSIEEKMEYKDSIVEIQKVYRCYAQKIRKLDVLNFQVMHAIDSLQLKDPLLVQKSTIQHIKPLVIPQTLGSLKAQKNIFDPVLKLVNELHWDLQLVYVGKICLSWEILCWYHVKIKQYDSQLLPRYDLVAAEFQYFQVLIQHFLEDDPFQDICSDCTKDAKKLKWGEEDTIASESLDEIIKESMQIFSEFVATYKDDGNVIQKVPHYRINEIKDREISELLEDIQTQLHKKERKLKEKLKSGNWIVRKFQKQSESQIQLDYEQLLAQVGLRLISKVINMEKLRKDHLIWCSEKLNQIKFVDKKIQVDASVFLFPC